ncbi:Nif11-like leader peptide family natural product precursor [bacterium D16-51]|nr:Nif11-like leader peptide family natural product precursor [bacterium D16-59]RKI56598.1 Nif11-like leader peptide family natural product precursor [bacterium D16-51]
MKKLLEEIEKNQELKAKIEELDKNPKSTPKDYIQAAAEYGIEIKEEDFKTTRGELSDDELDAVAGGKVCSCFVGGGGEGGRRDKICACVAFGAGEDNYADTLRCFCPLAGSGDTHDH